MRWEFKNPFWIRVLCLVVCLEKTFSINSTWIESMQICAVLEERASTKEDAVNKNTWIGTAKYVFEKGTIFLQVERMEKNKTCSEIPPPKECMVQREALDTEFIDCNNYFEYGCRGVEKQSEIKITVSVTRVGSSSKDFEECCLKGKKLFENGSTKLERMKMIWLLINTILIPMMFLIV